MTARDIVYGRRGGRWAAKPESEPAAEPKKVRQESTCRVCRERFYFDAPRDAEPPVICGQMRCRALGTWGPDEWAGAARMAGARLAAGVPLSDLDDEALHRAARKTA